MGAGVRVRDQTSRARLAHREVLALAWPAGRTPRPRMGTDAIRPSRCLALTRRHERGGSRLTPISAGRYTRSPTGTDAIHASRRLALTQRDERGGSRLTPISAGRYTRSPMGTDAIHPNCRLAVTQRDERVGSRLTRVRTRLYTRPRMDTDTIQPSRCLALTQPTTRLPDYPTTRLPDYPTTRLPRAASRSADRAAGDRPVPVLSAAASIRVAHSRHASVRPAADPVGRHFHQSRPACVATLAGRHHAWRAQACPFGAARGRQRRYGLED